MHVELLGVRQPDGKCVRLTGEARSLDAAVRAAQRRGLAVTSARILNDGDAPDGAAHGDADDGGDAVHETTQTNHASPAPRWPLAVAILGSAAAACLLALLFLPARALPPAATGPTAAAGAVTAADAAILVDAAHRRPVPQAPAEVPWVAGAKHPTEPNVVAGKRRGEWVAAPGYSLAADGGLCAHWTAGLAHPQFPKIASAEQEGYWTADPGYCFPQQGDLTVAWQAGRGHPKFPHIRSADEEGRWVTDPGYLFAKAGDGAVVWKPGIAHDTQPHVVAAEREGYWSPEPGYAFVKDGDLAVVWRPGQAHPTAPHVVASTTEGSWSAAPGYRFANDVRGDLSVVAKQRPNYDRAAEKALEAMFADWFAQLPSPDDPIAGLLTEVVRQEARKARQNALTQAIRYAFPDAGDRVVRSSADLLGRSADGVLSVRDWRASSVRDEVVQLLRSNDASAADAYELAEWLCVVCETYAQRRR